MKFHHIKEGQERQKDLFICYVVTWHLSLQLLYGWLPNNQNYNEIKLFKYGMS